MIDIYNMEPITYYHEDLIEVYTISIAYFLYGRLFIDGMN